MGLGSMTADGHMGTFQKRPALLNEKHVKKQMKTVFL